jgi:hypothetical protein
VRRRREEEERRRAEREEQERIRRDQEEAAAQERELQLARNKREHSWQMMEARRVLWGQQEELWQVKAQTMHLRFAADPANFRLSVS